MGAGGHLAPAGTAEPAAAMPPASEAPSSAIKRAFGSVTRLFKEPQITARPELIRDTVPLKCVGFLGGQSGAMKTFMAVHLSMCVITGRSFAGRKVETTGGVAFVAAEGKGSIAGRVKAARRQFEIGKDTEIPFVTISDFGALDTDDAFLGFEARLRQIDEAFQRRFSARLRVCFVDTVQAAGMIGVDRENDPATWSRLFQKLRGIVERVGVTIVLIHHFGKSATAGLRGSSDTRASAEFVLALTCDRDEVTGESKDRFLALSKHRDGCEGPIGAVEFEVVEIAKRDDGSPVTTLTVDIDTDRKLVTKDAGSKEPRALAAFREALAEALIDHGKDVRVDGEHNAPLVKAVPIEDVREAFDKFYVTGVNDEKKRANLLLNQFKNGLNKAQGARLCFAKTWGGREWIWLRDKAA